MVAINTINLGREMRAAQRLMKSGKTYASADLANPEIKLLKLGKD
ncbi:MAG: oxidoreductase C-terminal domain-containing protein [Alphaproteobacteria bacterium]